MYILIWITSILVCTAIAANKNRSVGGWFLLGVLFGPLAAIVVYVKAPLHTGPVERLQICPHCAETIKLAATVCRYCGRDLPPDTV